LSKYRQAREHEAIFSARRTLVGARRRKSFSLRASHIAAISGVIENG